MRYTINVKPEKAQNWGTTLARAEKRGDLTILDKDNAELRLQENIQKLTAAMSAFRSMGGSKELLIAWLRHKTNLNMEEINQAIEHTESFLKSLGALR